VPTRDRADLSLFADRIEDEMRIGSTLLLVATVTCVMIGGLIIATSGGSEPQRAPNAATGVHASVSQPMPFEECQPGPRGGGYDIRVVATTCSAASEILPDLFNAKTTRLVTERPREKVYTTEAGWICLVEALEGPPATRVVCLRESQAIIFKFA
jgi:hypothetical protein